MAYHLLLSLLALLAVGPLCNVQTAGPLIAGTRPEWALCSLPPFSSSARVLRVVWSSPQHLKVSVMQQLRLLTLPAALC